MNWDDYDAALFDLDGVLTPTAEVHMRAWRQLFEGYLAQRPSTGSGNGGTGSGSGEGGAAYTDQDYFDYIDGKPRYDGVRSFLASRGIQLPEGDAADGPEIESVCGLGNRKNAVFNQILAEDGVDAYPGSVELLDFLADQGKQVAVVSSSKNAPAVLKAAGILDRFEVIVDGAVAADEGIPGKPQPDTFVEAARRLDCTIERSVVFEDAISGVEAGHAGAFGLVVGVDRGVGEDRLLSAGADLVVQDLAELVSR